MHQRLKDFLLLKSWKEHCQKIKDPSCSAVYCVYFLQEPEKKYYGSTINFKRRKHRHLKDLMENKNNKNLQEYFNKWGIESIRFEILKKVSVKDLLIEEKAFVEKDGQCFNINSPLRLVEEIKSYNKARNNRPKRRSTYKGVVWSKPAQLWKAQPSITVAGGKRRQIYLGYFKEEEDARKVIQSFLNKINASR